MGELRDKFFNDELSIQELEALLQNQDWKNLLGLQADEWRDWVDGLDWENLGSSDLVNLIFKSIDVESGIEELHYFGVGVVTNIVSNLSFTQENQEILGNLLIDVATDTDTYGDFFLDTCDEDLVAEWLNLYEILAQKSEDKIRSQQLKSGRKELKQFFHENFDSLD